MRLTGCSRPLRPVPPSPALAPVATIMDALKGYTTAADSERILNQFRCKSAAAVLDIVEGVKGRASGLGMSVDQAFNWLRGDLTEENRRELRQILAQATVLISSELPQPKSRTGWKATQANPTASRSMPSSSCS